MECYPNQTTDPKYAAVLRIADLNPQNEMSWCMSRKELFLIGIKCALAAVLPFKPVTYEEHTHER